MMEKTGMTINGFGPEEFVKLWRADCEFPKVAKSYFKK